jgi:tRNA modification GTPase
VDVSYEYLARAAVVLLCGTDDDEIRRARKACADKTTAPIVAVQTKSDLGKPLVEGSIPVSSVSGSGLDQLLGRIAALLGDASLERDAPVLTRARHRERVGVARAEMAQFRDAWNRGEVPAVVAAVHLRAATASLEELIGRVDVEAILDEVFSRFCVGK